MKQLQIKPTKNGTDYVSVNFLEDDKRIGGFNASIKAVKAIALGGFMGELGINAVDSYIDSVGREQIIEDMKARASKKNNFTI
jgi:hypothetical protein